MNNKETFNKSICLTLCFLLFILCPMSMTASAATSDPTATNANSARGSFFPANDLSVRLLLGTTFRNEYSSAESTAASQLSQAETPFYNTWNITFTPSIAYIAPLPLDNCTLSKYTACDDSVCGSPCTNNSATYVHHKNASTNLSAVSNNISLSNNDLVLTFVSSDLCYIYPSGLHNRVSGLAYVDGSYALVCNWTWHTNIVNVRIIQHEISHLFNCIDNQCTAGYDCIMNGGLNNAPLNLADIWCPACKARFDPTAH